MRFHRCETATLCQTAMLRVFALSIVVPRSDFD
jgi:hypothetical protein